MPQPVLPNPAERARVVVIGSVHEDRFSYVDRLPAPGETVLGLGDGRGIGGKGANQAIAAAKLGADVALVAMVGDDPAGQAALGELTDARVEVSEVDKATEYATGHTAITVDRAGENVIVVHSAANRVMTPAKVAASIERLAAGRRALIVCQCEIQAAAVEAAAGAGHRFVLNLAPTITLDAAAIRRADPLVVNEVEARQLVERLGVGAGEEPRVLVEQLRRVAASVVITLGADGALAFDGAEIRHVPAAPAPDVVDSTGAGDAFVGALAAELADGADLAAAVRIGCLAGAFAVSRPGTTAAYPGRADLENR